MSSCAKTLSSIRRCRIPSMIEAWLILSEVLTTPSPRRSVHKAVFSSKLDGNTIECVGTEESGNLAFK